MKKSTKWGIFGAIFLILLITGLFVFFRYFFTYEQRNKVQRQIESVTGQDLTVTIFSYDGRVIKRWTGVQKISTGREDRDYTFFYTKDNKYVQIPNSVWYVAEETK